MGEQNCNRFGEWPSKNSTLGKHVVVVIVEIIKIMGWYSWKLNLIMIGIDDRRPQRKSAHGRPKFGVSLGSFVDCLNAFCRSRRSSTIKFPYLRPDMHLLFK